MTIAEISALITSLASLVVAGVSIGGLLVSLGNRRHIKNVERATKAVEHATNGMKDQLVAATKISSRSEGRDEERRHPTT